MVISLMRHRRSMRKFIKKQVEPEKIDILIEAALRSPSSMGRQPWEFIVVTENGLLDKLSRSKQHGSAFLKNAPLGIVVCADPEKSDVWIEDASVACTYIFLTAESLGLGACWTQIRQRMHNDTKTAQEYVSEVLNIPPKINVLSIIALGYPDEKKPPRTREELLDEKVYNGLYGKLFKSKPRSKSS